MKKLLLLVLCLGFLSVNASNPVYEVKKESIDVYVSQDSGTSIEMIASVDLVDFDVKDFSEGSYLVEVVFMNDAVAGIKTGIKEKEFLYVFSLLDKAKLNLDRIQNKTFDLDKRVKSKFKEKLKNESGIKIKPVDLKIRI